MKIETYSLDGKLLEVSENQLELNYQDKKEVWNKSKSKFSKDVLNRISIDSTYSRDFLISSKKNFGKPKVSIKLERINPSNQTFEIKVTNSAFCADFWLYSMKQGVRFERNFIHLLPGTHVIKGSFKNVPQEADFGFIFR